MIKLVYVLDRLPSISPEEFYDYWLNTHGPLVRKHAKTLRLKKYVQSHMMDIPATEAIRSIRGMLGPIAGITEIWWDSLEDFQAAYATPQGKAAGAELAADEDKFINIKGSHVFLTEEHPIFDYTDSKPLGEKAIKCAYLLVKREGMSREACHKYWLVDHGPYVTKRAEVLDMAKYVQSHTIAPEALAAAAKSRGFGGATLDGITEAWLADPEATAAQQADDGGEKAGKASLELVEDEKKFVEMGQSRIFMTKEHVIFDYIN